MYDATFPVLIIDVLIESSARAGIHMTGTVVGCLRRLQQWNLTPILEEVVSLFCNLEMQPTEGMSNYLQKDNLDAEGGDICTILASVGFKTEALFMSVLLVVVRCGRFQVSE